MGALAFNGSAGFFLYCGYTSLDQYGWAKTLDMEVWIYLKDTFIFKKRDCTKKNEKKS